LDINDSIIAASPLAGSDMATSVTITLPLDFSIEKEEKTIIAPEIISYSGTDTPEKYGYTGATANLIGLYDDFGRSINSFTFDILKEVSEVDAQNIFISPVSLIYAFGLLHPGCVDDAGNEIKNVFYLDGLTENNEELYQLFMDFGNYLHTLDDGVDLSLAHAFWYDNSLTPTSNYLTTINTYFGAEAEQIDFGNSSQVVKEINDWASEKTNEKIDEIVTENDVQGWIAALANATYFKGSWVNGFNSKDTKDHNFYTVYDSTGSVNCQMMSGGTIDDPWSMKTYRSEDFQLVRIPFKDKSRYEMACLMPFDKTCEEFLSDINGENWDQWMDNTHPTDLILNMPKFEERHKYYLPAILQELGMQNIFLAGALSRMFSNSTAFGVDEVIQSTYISVDEEGAEAAAVTVVAVWTSAGPMVTEITFDRPFIYAIQDSETHAIIFIGIMKDPTA
jgi:serpin B